MLRINCLENFVLSW